MPAPMCRLIMAESPDKGAALMRVTRGRCVSTLRGPRLRAVVITSTPSNHFRAVSSLSERREEAPIRPRDDCKLDRPVSRFRCQMLTGG
jgi:hypothetical protein